MNKGKTRKSIIKRGIAVGLIAVMASITPMQDVRPMGADVAKAATAESASQDKAPYIGEVRLSVDASPENAKLLLTLAGYEVIDQDLNQGAGAYWNDIGDQAVYMGIKRTNDKKKAIRDMKTMNMLGKYSYTGLKEKLEQNKKEAKELYQKISDGINEFADNYENKDAAAQSAYSMMNLYKEDDSDKLVGDYILGKPDEEDVMKVLGQGNTYGIAAMLRSLIYGAEKSTDDGAVWTERLSKMTSYSELLKIYTNELYGKNRVGGEKKEKVEKIIASDLDAPARALLAQWPEIRKIFTSAPESEERIMDTDGEITDYDEMLELSDDVGNSVATNYAKSIPYGKKTAYDLFTVSTSSFEKNIKNLYPLVYALSPGQRSLVEVANFADLFQASLLRQSAKENKEMTKEITEVQTGLEKSVDVVSIYDGVDRAIYADNAAMTSKATAAMEGQGIGNAIITAAIGSVLAVGAACMMVSGIRTLTTAKALDYIRTHFDVEKMEAHYNRIYETMKQKAFDGEIIWDFEKTKEVTDAKEAWDITKEAKNNTDKTFKIGAVMVVVSVILAAVSVYLFYKSMKNLYNRKQLPIPDVLVDYDVQNKAGKNVAYHVVKWNKNREDKDRADRADLNGDVASQWLALYTTTDEVMGVPILADGIVANVGDSTEPRSDSDAPYVPLTMFGNESVQNLVDEEYSYNDSVNGIYVWYQKEVSSDVIEDDTDNGGAVSGEASTTGSNIGGTNMVLFTLGGGVAGLIIGVFIGYFTRRKKQTAQ